MAVHPRAAVAPTVPIAVSPYDRGGKGMRVAPVILSADLRVPVCGPPGCLPSPESSGR
jgi:hypothetical protein